MCVYDILSITDDALLHAEAALLHANVGYSIPACPPPLGGMRSDEISVVVIYDKQSVIISPPDTYSPFWLASVRPPLTEAT